MTIIFFVILKLSVAQAGVVDHLVSVFKVSRGELPEACRFDMAFSEVDRVACEDLHYTTLIVEEHFFPSDSTEELFFDVFEKLPRACLQYRSDGKYKDDARWPCLFWGIKEKVKYNLLSFFEGCGDEKDFQISLRELELLYESCNTHLVSKYGLVKAAQVSRDVCRNDEYIKFHAAVKDRSFILINQDLLRVAQPSFEKDQAPDYFYLLNSCDKRVVKRVKRFATKPLPKKECEDDSKKGPIQDLIQKSFPVLAETTENPQSLEQVKSSLKEMLSEKLKQPDLVPKVKELFLQMLKDERYLERTASFYKNIPFAEIQSSFKAELNRTESKIKNQKISVSEDYSDHELDLKAGVEVGLEKKGLKKYLKVGVWEKEDQKKLEKEEKVKLLSKDLRIVLDDLPLSTPTASPSPAPIKNTVDLLSVKKPAEKHDLPHKKGKIPKLKSKEQLIAEAKRALEQYQKNKTSRLDFADFFLQTELSEMKSPQSVWDHLHQRLEGWKKYVRSEQEKQVRDNQDVSWQLYHLVSKLNDPFLKNYSRDEAWFLNCFNGKGCNCDGQTKFLFSMLKAANYKPEPYSVLAVQTFSDHVQLVEWNKKTGKVKNVLTGEISDKIVAPLYDPHILIQAYLEKKDEDDLSASDFLIAEKNVVNSKNKGERSGISTNSLLELPQSDVSFGSGAEIPKKAIIGLPITPGSTAVFSNPMDGSDGVWIDHSMPKTLITDEKKMKIIGYPITFKNKQGRILSYDVSVRSKESARKLGVAQNPLIKNPHIEMFRSHNINPKDGGATYGYEEGTMNVFVDRVEPDTIWGLNNKLATGLFDEVYQVLKNLEQKDIEHFYSSEEWKKTLEILSDPSALLESSPEFLRQLPQFLKDYEQYLPGINNTLEKRMTFGTVEDRVTTTFTYDEWKKIHPESSIETLLGIDPGKPVAQQNYERYKLLKQELNHKLTVSPEKYFELVSSLDPERMKSYLDILSEVGPIVDEFNRRESLLYYNFIRVNASEITFEVEEKGVPEEISPSAKKQNRDYESTKEENDDFGIHPIDRKNKNSDSDLTNPSKQKKQKPQSVVKRNDSNRNPDQKKKYKIPPENYFKLVLEYYSKLPGFKLTSPLLKEIRHRNKNGEQKELIESYLEKLVKDDLRTYGGVYTSGETDLSKNDKALKRISLCRGSVCRRNNTYLPEVWKLILDYFEKNTTSNFSLHVDQLDSPDGQTLSGQEAITYLKQAIAEPPKK